MEEEQTLNTENQLVDTETYLKSGIHIGTKFKTKYMEKFIYKTRPDGLSILDIAAIDERLRVLGSFVSNYNPEDILVVSRRENGWRPLRMLEKFTGIRIHAGRYSPGMLTNPQLDKYTNVKLLIVTDSWPDRNAVKDALRVGIPVVALCDTNNQANNLDLVIPCNNKGKKSLALVFYTLAVQYLQNRGEISSAEELGATLEEFADE